jgi:hypothetical protein
MLSLKPAFIAALVARCHGQVILTREELFDAERRLMIDLQENERGEIVITTYQCERLRQIESLD